jgi:NADH-quinone oxidoreductase subunit C
MSATQTLSPALETLRQALEGRYVSHTTYQGELSVVVKAEEVHGFLQHLRDSHGFNYLVDISAVDHYRDEARFEVSYNVYALEKRLRIRVKTFLEEDNLQVPTVTDIWSSANWYEREAYDMMGIQFQQHPDLRRIYMPEDFQFFPLRKEFPLIGIPGSIQMPEKEGPKGYK